MQIDTDILIWYLRGNEKAFDFIEKQNGFNISVVTYMELIQGMRNKHELSLLRNKIKIWDCKVIYINEEISTRALFYIEKHFLSHSMEFADALIGATAATYGLKLATCNDKHYKQISGLEIEKFRI